jgi:hypothetical protein
MAPSRFPLTAAVQQTIVAYSRGGGYPHVAAEAAGIPLRVFDRWMRKGEGRRAPERYRAFALAVRQAAAQARLGAEVAVRDGKPLDWLRSGPGKETPERPGWTGPVRPRLAAPAAAALLDASLQAHITEMLRVLEPYPQARAALGAVFATGAGE